VYLDSQTTGDGGSIVKHWTPLAGILLALFVMSGLAACDPGCDEDLQGTWTTILFGWKLSLKPDGTYTTDLPLFSPGVSGTYTYTGSSITFVGIDATEVWAYEIADDCELTITKDPGNSYGGLYK
jgi:hypothetical protein